VDVEGYYKGRITHVERRVVTVKTMGEAMGLFSNHGYAIMERWSPSEYTDDRIGQLFYNEEFTGRYIY